MGVEIELETDFSTLTKAETWPDKIHVIDTPISYSTFFKSYLSANLPCIFKDISNQWPCTKLWFKNEQLNFDYLTEKYGQQFVPVANCDEKYFNSQKKKNILFVEYLDYWKTVSADPQTGQKLYLKDWHLQRLESKNKFYNVPVYFASDWLNEYLIATGSDDYMFVYMGPTGTWTPFHADVFTSYSWSTNIYGRKLWRLYPPGEENWLRDNFGNLPYDCTAHTTKTVKFYEIVQETGDAIFVPSGWYHQVWNTAPTVSINHNWINGCNIETMFDSMQTKLLEVQREISDCKDMENWDEQCQIILDADFGLNFNKLYKFLYHIGNKRIDMLEKGYTCLLFEEHKLGSIHAVYDLYQIRKIINKLIEYENMFDSIAENPCDFISRINNILSSRTFNSL